ncbi:insecticidal delta-endotoxin Cry8Ea1 family protein [Nocardia mikamii]|uniref:insecticidal delta-endotoxin Cry8Ea1 family protein n=1 Tax=Nocardia mikamii TaxID=508464 RepID=UPI0007A53BCE|nr:insecticidal delta-endotoxin Cry8Ea1 family protein [Nocardia mikamii]
MNKARHTGAADMFLPHSTEEFSMSETDEHPTYPQQRSSGGAVAADEKELRDRRTEVAPTFEISEEQFLAGIFWANKQAICMGLGFVPVIGGLLGSAVGMLMDAINPADQEEAKERQEALIRLIREVTKQEIQVFYNESAKKILEGLQESVDYYRKYADQYGTDIWDMRRTNEELNGAIRYLKSRIPDLTVGQYRFDALPYLAMAASMHLMLLREKLKFAKILEISEGDTEVTKSELKEGIKKYVDYVRKTYEEGQKRPMPHWSCNVGYARIMYLSAYEFTLLWPYMEDPEWKPTDIPREIELHFGPFGYDQSPDFRRWIDSNWPGPKKPQTSESLWSLEIGAEFGTKTVSSWESSRTVEYALINQCSYNENNTSGTSRRVNRRTPARPPWRKRESFFPDPYPNPACITDLTLYCSKPQSRGPYDTRFRRVDIKDWSGSKDSIGIREDSDSKLECSIPGFALSQLRILSQNSLGQANCMMASFKPDSWNDTFNSFNVRPKLVSGQVYHVIDADGGGFLDVDHYTLTGSPRPVVREGAGSRSRDWVVYATEDGGWVLVNAYSRQRLQHGPDGLRLVDADEPATGDNVWDLHPNPASDTGNGTDTDGTWMICCRSQDRDHYATVADDTLVEGQSDRVRATRWVLAPAPVLGDALADQLPSLWTDPSPLGYSATTEFILHNPTAGEVIPGPWTLRLMLPAETGDGLILDSADGLELTHTRTDRGTQATITAATPPAPGETITFTLTSASGRIAPTDITLDNHLLLTNDDLTTNPTTL